MISDWIGGTNINYSGLKNLLILSNLKKNNFSIFDLRKNCIIKTIEVAHILY